MIQNLSKNEEIVVLKESKDRGVVILDRSKYIEKCLSILRTKRFAEINRNPTVFIEGKVQRTLRIIKKLPSFVYFKIYPTGSLHTEFYVTAKLHKVPNNGTAQQLPIGPIIYNIRAATYDLVKYLAQLLKTLSESQYTIKKSKTFK